MDGQGDTSFNLDQEQLQIDMGVPTETSVLHMPNVVDVITSSRAALQSELADTAPDNVAPNDKTLLDISQPDVTFGLVDTLQHHDIDTLEIETSALTGPRSALQTVFEAGDGALREQGFPSPDIENYREAMQTAQSTGQDFHGVMSEMRAAEPLSMRQDLIPRDSVEFMDAPDTVGAVPEIEGPVAETQYDVHFMGYPLGYKDIGPIRIESRPSHAYIAVTERGMDPMNSDNVLLATRAGPDNAEQTIFLPDSSLPNDEQSPTEKTNSGNLYVLDDQGTRETDVVHNARFHVETSEVTHDLDTMRDMMNNHGRLINNMDIDYEVLNLNSNTYAGDSYRILTGEDAPAFKYEGLGTHYFPAITNDVMNYSNTEFAESFSYQPANVKHLESSLAENYVQEEDYSYGLE